MRDTSEPNDDRMELAKLLRDIQASKELEGATADEQMQRR
jgi:hypothetical protein